MKIDTLGVQALIALADTRNFNRAAASLNITQTALSRRLQNLEAFLGVRLVERTTRSVALTQVGAEFLPQARRLLTELAAALTEIRETGKALRGDVTIACVPAVGVHYLPRIIREYSARFPRNRIRILDQASFAVAQAVLRREAEFGIGMKGAHHPELASAPLVDDRFVLVCRRDHALAGRKRIAWKQLAGHAWILAGHEGGNRPLLDGAMEKAGVEVRPTYEVQRSATALGLAAKGVGVAVVPGLALEADAYPQLRVIPLGQPVVARTLVLITRARGHLTPAAQALHDLIISPYSTPSAPRPSARPSRRGVP
jgi:DNA-binding transcriptional LysR family regulator